MTWVMGVGSTYGAGAGRGIRRRRGLRALV